ncbi:glycosyl transferase [Cloacibacterium rupense]|uniref:Glycosyl transferase n=1 Tax=Cloacibacterium rupense TaxID=517423 RepID=A0ABQ2NNA6_9FLAO|nr:glycosyltransferase family 4 protein [Cloacibacterium rupense]GGP06536.1 glycosyl transferase [Cloacibacterium rupense]
MKKKIIAVGTTTQNNTLVNGQSMMFQLIVDSLQKRGIEIIIIDYGLSIYKDFKDKRISGNFSFIKLLDNFFLTFKYIGALVANPGAKIYINTAQSKVGFIRNSIFIYLGKLFNRKVVGHQFGANYENFYNSQPRWFKKIIKKTLDKTDVFIVEGDYTKNQMSFVKNYQEHVVSIPNGLPEKIDVSKILPKKINENDEIRLLYLSNLIESKGYWDVLEAVKILNSQYNIKLKAIFAGKFLGDVDDTIAQNANEAKKLFFLKLNEYGLQDIVEYYEGLYSVKKAEAFMHSHFFILPSYYCNEGQPVSVLEAIAYGCVPIVTEYRLIPLMVNKKNGFFVPKKSPNEIANKIFWCIENTEEYNKKSKNGIDFFNSNFTAELYIDKIFNLIN